ncbi:hypothetical protein B0T10DRAFT_463797 [Thelonectria olida]|uniref:Uncharacterized protein n=1 Tax=Thelonectria olida TaxID=1576542 RepID=A0A9P8VWT6_9HYPO|nr:hypothetical protein B0T10DRAFT_463797 [Thelonectria olida]
MKHTRCLLASLLGLASNPAAAIDCGKNITIENAANASQVRKACSTIGGDLLLSTAIPESDDINLDGVEAVLGSIIHNGCFPDEEGCDQTTSSLYDISSSTLRTVSGSIIFRNYDGVGKLLLPSLEVVNGSVFLSGLLNLTHLDVTNLAYTGDFSLNAPVLEQLDIDGLRGFTDEIAGVIISDVGSIDSVDAFFDHPLQVESPDGNSDIRVTIRNSTNIRNVTVAWPYISKMMIYNKDIAVTLGGSSTESMHIDSLTIPTGFHRDSKLQNLTVGRVEFTETSAVEKITLPFDDLAYAEINDNSEESKLRTIVLPPEAANWTNHQLSLSARSLVFREYDDDNSKIWYWPAKMKRISLEGIISANFFDSFFERNTTVTERIYVRDNSAGFNCTAFEEKLGSNAPGDFHCLTDFPGDDSAGSGLRLWSFQLQVAVTLAVMLVFLG